MSESTRIEQASGSKDYYPGNPKIVKVQKNTQEIIARKVKKVVKPECKYSTLRENIKIKSFRSRS